MENLQFRFYTRLHTRLQEFKQLVTLLVKVNDPTIRSLGTRFSVHHAKRFFSLSLSRSAVPFPRSFSHSNKAGGIGREYSRGCNDAKTSVSSLSPELFTIISLQGSLFHHHLSTNNISKSTIYEIIDQSPPLSRFLSMYL